MDRRHFSRLSVLGATGAWLGDPSRPGHSSRPSDAREWFAPPRQALAVDGRRLGERMRTLATFGANADGGIDRLAFSDANIEALDWIAGLLGNAGFTTKTDVAGNLIARKAGSEAGRRAIMFGSHIDSVPGGGNYDGQVGSMGAVEVAATLADAGHTTRHPLEVAFFTNEEGGKTGSRALAGEVEAFELDLETASGYTIGVGLRRLGGDPDRLMEARREAGSLAGFLELHVEQGAVLDQDDVDIGIVEGIVGIMRWNVTVEGRTNHAGTTPMDRRADAMVGAAQFVSAVHRIASTMPGRQVATVGRLVAEPGVPNVIPGRVRMTLEIRDLSMDSIARVYEAIAAESDRLAAASGMVYTFDRFYVSGAAPTDLRIRDMIEEAASGLRLSASRMPSGAGHDAQSIALLCPVGMIFVPSVDGISHAPNERTELSDIENGSNVLLQTLLLLDARGLS
ncbi:MAG: Zn-dependent hydrolase [Gemmatimonadetes bacterium]|nr:Zn-dependent hydrolase [Gemmatimonadota bacterium]MDA1103274.1 Zn-dependent hydrolase [Gemmatimonadota bacterium]